MKTIAKKKSIILLLSTVVLLIIASMFFWLTWDRNAAYAETEREAGKQLTWILISK